MKRNSILLISFYTLVAAACGGPEPMTGESTSAARIFDPENPPDPPGDPDPEPPPPQLAAPYLDLIQRSSGQIRLRWRDVNDIEHGNIIERMGPADGAFTTLAALGPQALGLHEYTDLAVSPDARYCYRVKAFDGSATRSSTTRCAWTSALTPEPVWRVQLQMVVADVDDAGTDDRVMVQLNALSPSEHPYGNVTTMDYGRDDFERNSVFTYDLDQAGISDLADINRIVLSKEGEDGVCLRRFTLIVNQAPVFEHDFTTSGSPCHWLDYGGGHSTSFEVTAAELRAHGSWIGYTTQTPPVVMRRADLESRFEGLVGNAIAGTSLQWGHFTGRAVEITQTSPSTFRIDLDLEAGINNLPNPEVDVDIEMQVGFVPSASQPGTWELRLSTLSSAVNVDYSWFWEVLSLVLEPLCAPIGTIVAIQPVWECSSSIESYVESRVQGALKPIEKAVNVGNSCTPQVDVRPNGDIIFSCQS